MTAETKTRPQVAIMNAAKENPELAVAYRAALDRRPARVFIHVPSEQVYGCLVKLRDSFKEDDKAAIRFPAVRKYAGVADSNQEIRFFHSGDRARAEQIAGLFGPLGLELAVKDLSATPWAQSNVPNSYELWFSGKSLPPICQPQAG